MDQTHSAKSQRKIKAYITLTRLNSPIGIYLLLWPMLWALWFAAAGVPDFKILLIFIAGTILTRSAGCAINDYADRHFDRHVARTFDRPIVNGDVSPKEAIAVAAVLMLLAFGLVLLTNKLTIMLSFGALALASLYPFAKRVTHWPQVVLGAAFSWAIPMAYAAQTGEVSALSWLVFSASVVWAVAYDTLYAMADRDDDLRIGVKSTAVLFGTKDILMVIIFQCLMLLIMVWVGYSLGRGIIYFAGVSFGLLFVVYQAYLVRDREPERCIQAFLNNSYLGMVIFIGIVLDYALINS